MSLLYRLTRSALAAVVVALLSLGLGASPSAARPPVIPIVLSGDPAPNGSTFAFAREAALTADGRPLIVMNIDTGPQAGIYTGDGQGGFDLVVRSGDTTPGMPPGTSVFVFFDTHFNRSGQVAFEASLSPTFEHGIWGPGPGGVPTLLAREGGPAPGTPAGVTFGSLFDLSISELGQVVFTANLEGPGIDQDNSNGIWATNLDGVLELRLRGGDTHPDLPADTFFKSFSFPSLDSDDVLAFLGGLRGAPINSGNAGSRWGNDGFGALQLVSRTGDQVPVLPTGALYRSLGRPMTNSSGFSAFRDTLTGSFPVVTTLNFLTIMGRSPTGSLMLLARKGFQAPGAAPGITLGGFFAPVVNEAGDVAFSGFVEGPGFDLSNRGAAFGPGVSGELTWLVQQGEPADDVPEGVTILGVGTPALTPLGGIVASTGLSGPGVTGSNNLALYYSDALTMPTVILRTGDAIEVAAGDTRVVESYLAILDPENALGMNPIDDDGELVVRLIFTDGTNGFFRIPVPEPSAPVSTLAALGLLVALARSRGARR